VEWLEAELINEMNRLPYVREQNFGVFQGRCQMVKEIIDFIKNSPDRAVS
jgi:hypothetical protein